jgi:zeta-carotene desaturase
LHEVVDCQHVLLGCCTSLLQLFERSNLQQHIRWYDELTFLEPGGRRSRFTPGPLPAPLHFTGSFLRAQMLGNEDKLAIARGLMQFLDGIPGDDHQSLASWLQQNGQTERALRHFWEPVVLCTLNDDFERCSLRHSAQVFRELFLKSPAGARLGIPTIPLSDLYTGATAYAESHGARFFYRASVDGMTRENDGRWKIRSGSAVHTADAVILAVPFEQVEKLLPDAPSSRIAQDLQEFVHGPYTTVHLWFDREVSDLDHAALLDTTIQWMFHKSRIRRWAPEKGSYIELVIAASRRQLEMERQEILDAALSELAQFLPELKKAKLVKSGILKEARATFSVLPGLDAYRPHAESDWPRLYFAGDWTATSWPSTMEGAARSGYLAAEAVTRGAGDSRSILPPDLAPRGLMRLFG